jgi:hypothetical protein
LAAIKLILLLIVMYIQTSQGIYDAILIDGFNVTQVFRPTAAIPVVEKDYSLPHRCGSASVYTTSGIYITGGGRLNKIYNSVDYVNVFYPSSESFSTTAHMLESRSCHAAVATIGV